MTSNMKTSRYRHHGSSSAARLEVGRLAVPEEASAPPEASLPACFWAAANAAAPWRPGTHAIEASSGLRAAQWQAARQDASR